MVPAIHLAPEFTAKDLPFELAFLFYLCNIEAIKKQGQKTILVRFANSDDDKTEVAKMDIQAWFLHPTDPYVDVAVAKIPDGMTNFRGFGADMAL